MWSTRLRKEIREQQIELGLAWADIHQALAGAWEGILPKEMVMEKKTSRPSRNALAAVEHPDVACFQEINNRFGVLFFHTF